MNIILTDQLKEQMQKKHISNIKLVSTQHSCWGGSFTDMTARFAAEKELKSLLDDGYASYPTELGGFYIPLDTHFTKETVTLGFQRFLLKTGITVDGVDLKLQL